VAFAAQLNVISEREIGSYKDQGKLKNFKEEETLKEQLVLILPKQSNIIAGCFAFSWPSVNEKTNRESILPSKLYR
jgi:hypothetical protein